MPAQPAHADPRPRLGAVGRLRGAYGSRSGGRHRLWFLAVVAAMVFAVSTVAGTLFPSTSMVWLGSHGLSAGVAVNAAVNVHNRGSSDNSEYRVSAGHSHGSPTTTNVILCGYQTYYVLAGDTPILVHNCGGYDLRGKDPMSIVPDNASIRELTPHSNGGAQYGLEFKWTNSDGQTVRLRIHGPDSTAPAGSNAAIGDTFRVQVGGRYQDIAGNLFHRNVHKPGSPFYDPTAANATHIPWPSQFPGL